MLLRLASSRLRWKVRRWKEDGWLLLRLVWMEVEVAVAKVGGWRWRSDQPYGQRGDGWSAWMARCEGQGGERRAEGDRRASHQSARKPTCRWRRH